MKLQIFPIGVAIGIRIGIEKKYVLNEDFDPDTDSDPDPDVFLQFLH
ncbi:MAG: hypothetical protein K9K64_12060 [Desulfohalobiaceae bacterium]|nr:hypothetical protein [Desulfohalobiaceae bacterium]